MDKSFLELLLSQKALPSPIKCFNTPAITIIAQTICAFLNDRGGWIIVGLDDSCNPIEFNINDVCDQLQYEVSNNISPLPLVYIQQEQFKNKHVILITVLKGSMAPYSFKGKYYVMVGDEVMLPSLDQISSLLRNSFSIKSNWESLANLISNPENLNRTQMDEVYKYGLSCNRLSKSSDGLYSLLSDLKLVDFYEVKNGALCLFGDELDMCLPQCRVRIQYMSDGKTSEKYDNTLLLKGNIFALITDILKYFTNTLPQQSFFTKNQFQRIDDYLYPMDVLREAISNALIHRDYTDPLSEISIFLYSDKIEIKNPGLLPDDLVKGKNRIVPHGSILRNPLMAEIFYIAGYMEKTGRGMDLISKRMRELGKKLPEWTCSNHYTTLTIFNRPLELLFNQRIASFLEHHSHNEIFSKSEYIDYFEKRPSKVTAQTDIAKMLELKLCIKIGNGPSTRYQIIGQKLTDTDR